MPIRKHQQGWKLTFTLGLLSGLLAHSGLAADKPELTRLFPAGGQAGTTVDVEASGKFADWPIKVWSDSSAIEWGCQKESGKLQVKIGADASPGLHWVRFYHENGATAVRPFLVGRSQQRIEKEPNDGPREANEIESLPYTIQGVLNKRADVDLYAVSLTAGQTLAATIDAAKWLESPADATLQVLDGNGFVLAENLDHVGLDPYLEFKAPRDEKYFVRVFAFPATPDSTVGFSGGNEWIYRLRLDSHSEPHSSALSFVMQSELESKRIDVEAGKYQTQESALTVQLPARLGGVITEPKQSNFFRFAGRSGTPYRVRVLAREFGSSLDASVAILDSKGKQLTQLDDVGNERDPVLNWKAPADGEYLVEINDFHREGSAGHRYIAIMEERQADYSVSIASDLISLTVGKELETSVSIDRENDFKDTLQVTIADKPDSLECSIAESKNGTDTSKKVVLKLKATSPYQGSIKILATPADASGVAKQARAPNRKPIWLSVTAQ